MEYKGWKELIHFESFSSLTPEIIDKLLNETNANLEILDNFLHDCAKAICHRYYRYDPA